MNRKLYVIRAGQYEVPVDIVSGPHSPALSTMIKKFNERFGVPAPLRLNTPHREYSRYFKNLDVAKARIRAAGYSGDDLSELFVDWLLKTDKRFERVEYREVSI
jgi:hypothetical protein